MKGIYKKIAAFMMAFALLLPHGLTVRAENADSQAFDAVSELAKYDFERTKPGKGSADSMPIGNGDITANVWVEENGDLLFYIGKSDTWSEATRLLKVGKVRVKLDPNPFVSGNEFLQVLKLNDGEITVAAGPEDNQVRLRIWVDANHPVIRVEAEGDQKFDMEVSTEIWRDTEIAMTNETSHSYRGLTGNSGITVKESADQTIESEDSVIWYHRNAYSNYNDILENQRMDDNDLGPDPYLNRTFGACLKGEGFSVKDQKTLTAANGKTHSFSVYPYTAQTESLDDWKNQLSASVSEIENLDFESARTAHQEWWEEFWNRSYIFISGDDDAYIATRAYIMQRYMQAIQGRGSYPIKFNGGTITYDYVTDNPVYAAVNGDYRKWGPCYWFQNTRLLYWNMLAAGDFESMLPLFDMYYNMLDTQKAVTREYYGHDGAFFPETINFFGLYSPEDFGWNNDGVETESQYIRYYWQGGLELSAMMLEYYDYTKDEKVLKEKIIPVAEAVIKFYDEHYDRNADGILEITPSHVLETYWDNVKNPVEVVAGLDRVLTKLLALPDAYTTAGQRAEWNSLHQALPEIPVGTDGEVSYIKPAETYDASPHNTENPELYPVFPYKAYGVGKDDLETAINTYNRRLHTGNLCWRQNGIHSAYLGLADDAKEDIMEHFRNVDSPETFPGYWGNGFDWTPDLDNGGSAMLALQVMLLQCQDDNTAYVFPAWPSEWDVNFKLCTPDQGTITGSYQNGSVVSLNASDDDLTLVLPDCKVKVVNPQGLTITSSQETVNAGDELELTVTKEDYVESFRIFVNGEEIKEENGKYLYQVKDAMGSLTVTAKVTYTFAGEVPQQGILVRLSADQDVTKGADNKVSKWGTVSQDDSSKQPLYVENAYKNGAAIRFDGASQYLSGDAAEQLNDKRDMTMVIVANRTLDPATDDWTGATIAPFGFADQGWGGLYLGWGLGTVKYRFGTGAENCHTVYDGKYVPSNNTLTSVMAVKAGADEYLYVDGTMVQNSEGKEEKTANIGSSLLVGRSDAGQDRYFGGDICEILIYDHALSEVEQIQLQQYIDNKYFRTGVSGVTLSQDSAIMTEGDRLQLTAAVEPADADEQTVIWTSDRPDVASVDGKGQITAHAAGEAVITVTTLDGDYTASCTVTVQAKAVPEYKVTVRSGTGSGDYQEGETVTIKADPAPEGKQFEKWEVVSGDAVLAAADKEETTFVMPAGEVVLRAVYADDDSSGTGGDGDHGDGDDGSGEDSGSGNNNGPAGDTGSNGNNTSQEETDSENDTGANVSAPQTGESENIVFAVLLIMVSAVLAGSAAVYKRKK